MPFDSALAPGLELGDLVDPIDPDRVARRDQHHTMLDRWIKSPNIAAEPEISVDELGRIGMLVKREYDIDFNSCSDWREKYRKHLDLAMQVAEEKTYPWPGAANCIWPVLTTAALQFNARAYPAIVNGPRIVKGTVVGKDDGQPLLQGGQPVIGPQGPVWMVPPGVKRQRADNIADHMSWQLLTEQEEWEPDTDRLLIVVPITGFCARKTWFDPVLGRNRSDLITGDKLVVNYKAKSWATAPRMTEEQLYYPLEIEENVRSGIWLDQAYPASTGSDRDDGGDDDAPIEFLEQHRRLDLDDDGYPEPYIVTVHKQSGKVARIVARYDAASVMFSAEDDRVTKITPVEYFTPYWFFPDPAGGIYGMGLGQLLDSIGSAINTTLNQMLDAGHLQIRGGGFIGKSLSMNTGNVRFAMGEYKAVNVTGATLRDNLVPLTFPGPNAVLFQLLGSLIEAAKEISATKDILSGDLANANVPATTTIALIEQGLKVFTAIYKRLHRSMASEFRKLYRLNSIYLPEESNYKAGEEWRFIRRQDYDKHAGVEPISDPSRVSDMQRLSRAQFLMQFGNDPQCNGHEIRRRIFTEANVENVDQVLNPQVPPNPMLLARLSETASKAARDRAAESRDIAQAIYFLAQARKASDDNHLGWFDQQLEVYRMALEQATGQTPGTPPGVSPTLGGAPGPLAPPGGPGAAPLPGLPPAPGMPPIPGLRRAPDGMHYAPDPRRPGKYVMVV